MKPDYDKTVKNAVFVYGWDCDLVSTKESCPLMGG